MYSSPPIHGASIVATILNDRSVFEYVIVDEWVRGGEIPGHKNVPVPLPGHFKYFNFL